MNPPVFRRRAAALLALAFLLAVVTTLPAQETAAERERQARETEQALAQLRADINALKDGLGAGEQAENTAVSQLAAAERAVSDHQRALAQIDERRQGHEQDLVGIAERQVRVEAELDQQRAALAALLRLDHRRSRQAAGKTLLAPEQHASLPRVLGYSRLLRDGRLAHIDRLGANLAELVQLQADHDSANAGLERERTAAEQEREQLVAAVAEREAALDAIRRELHDQRQRLTALGRDERQLVQLLERLRDIFADLPATLEGSEPFARRRGQLAWPADGRSERSGDGLRIAGNEGDPVRAIGYGRVAYADWLRGYGLLLIVDHGDGYMSLYGHNEALLAAEGSWVQDGQTIARIGRSGGEATAGLYFELRERGRSVDPQRWLRRR